MKEVKVDEEKIEAVSEFLLSRGHALCWRWLRAGCCNMLQMYLGQVLPSAPPPPLTNRSLSLVDRGRVYSTCVKNVMLHVVKTWPMTAATQNMFMA